VKQLILLSLLFTTPSLAIAQDGHRPDSCKYEYELRSDYEADSLSDVVMDTIYVFVHSCLNDDSSDVNGHSLNDSAIQLTFDSINVHLHDVYLHMKHTVIIRRNTALSEYLGIHDDVNYYKTTGRMIALSPDSVFQFLIGGTTASTPFPTDPDTNAPWQYYFDSFGGNYNTNIHEFGHVMDFRHVSWGIVNEPACAGYWRDCDHELREDPHWWQSPDSLSNYRGDMLSSTPACPGYKTSDRSLCVATDTMCTDSAFHGTTLTNYMVASPITSGTNLEFTHQQLAQIRCKFSNNVLLYRFVRWFE